MPHQSEQQLENEVIEQLSRYGFDLVVLEDTASLKSNLKGQLEKFNETIFSEDEYTRVYNHLNRGDRFQKAKTLRDRFALSRDDGSTSYIRFFNMEKWCQNEYQVAQQITQVGRYENRYDVNLLI